MKRNLSVRMEWAIKMSYEVVVIHAVDVRPDDGEVFYAYGVN